jgi:UDP-N-acetylglucosamine 1-carboxyvinyltransferase
MDKICVKGGVPLVGKIEIGGAKNAALPLMAACLLSAKPLKLSNLPHLMDITTMANLLINLGVDFSIDGSADNGGHMGRVLVLDAKDVNSTTAPYDIVRKMRASVVVLGPLVARFGHAKVSLPGGCAIGPRPIDLHLMALEKMGAKIKLEHGYIHAQAPDGLHGAIVEFPFVSVGATENTLMAATLAKGKTIIKNAAREPEVSDLAHCLNAMGARITGIDTDTLTVEGQEALGGASYSVIPDRIEAGTYAVAAAITGGDIELIGIRPDIMEATLGKLKEAGVKITLTKNGFRVQRKGKIKPIHLSTAPYPEFATDMQAQFMALLCLADGESVVEENIFENRYMHVPELSRMGAQIEVDGKKAIIRGVKELKDAEVMATDLRASVSLVLAALAATGVSTINRVYHIDRGYENVEEKLGACGAKIERLR